MAAESAALLRRDPDALRDERLFPPGFDWPPEPLFGMEYERIGADRAAAGQYGTIIRYSAHVRPIALALRGAG
jgi:hypothetical protein